MEVLTTAEMERADRLAIDTSGGGEGSGWQCSGAADSLAGVHHLAVGSDDVALVEISSGLAAATGNRYGQRENHGSSPRDHADATLRQHRLLSSAADLQ